MDAHLSAKDAIDLLFALKCKGIRVWAQDGRLHYHASHGALDPNDALTLRERRTEILTLLSASAASVVEEPTLVVRNSLGPAPLLLSQQGWLGVIAGRPSRRLGVATGVMGALDQDCLRKTLLELVIHHESLRTRIERVEGYATQTIAEACDFDLEVIDLRDEMPDVRNRESCARRLVQQFIAEPIDVSVGPLFAARLLKLDEADHVLCMAIDHLISDGASLAVLHRHIWTLYSHRVRQLPFSLPGTSVRLADIAAWQREVQQFCAHKSRPYWNTRFSGAPAIHFPRDEEAKNATRLTFCLLPMKFGRVLSTQLREFCQRERTSLPVAVLTAYITLISRWCNASDVVVVASAAARDRPELENFIGFLASGLAMRVTIRKEDHFLDLMRRVAEEYTAAYEHSAWGGTPIELAKEIPRGVGFNWVPHEFSMEFAPDLGRYELRESLEAQPFMFDMEVFAFDDIDLDWNPSPTLWDTQEGVKGHFVYRSNRSSFTTVERLERNLRSFVERLITQPNARIDAMSCL